MSPHGKTRKKEKKNFVSGQWGLAQPFSLLQALLLQTGKLRHRKQKQGLMALVSMKYLPRSSGHGFWSGPSREL